MGKPRLTTAKASASQPAPLPFMPTAHISRLRPGITGGLHSPSGLAQFVKQGLGPAFAGGMHPASRVTVDGVRYSEAKASIGVWRCSRNGGTAHRRDFHFMSDACASRAHHART